MKITYRYKEEDPPIFSRYRLYDRVIAGGYKYVETFDRVNILPSSRDSIYLVESDCENRIDKVSYKFYGNPFYWWIIAIANGITNPIYLKPGTSLRIPSLVR